MDTNRERGVRTTAPRVLFKLTILSGHFLTKRVRCSVVAPEVVAASTKKVMCERMSVCAHHSHVLWHMPIDTTLTAS